MRSWDAIVLGAGIIGLSIARELRRQNIRVLVIDRAEPAREASYAAAGMLDPRGEGLPRVLQELGAASARLYPEFVAELEDESGIKVDLRSHGAIVFLQSGRADQLGEAASLTHEELTSLEPLISLDGSAGHRQASYVEERSVDPRALVQASLQAAKHHGIDVVSGSPVTEITADSSILAVHTARARYSAAAVINCCGAWAGEINAQGVKIPARPVKGQMLCVISQHGHTLLHVIRAPEVYLVPRSDGRLLIGATVEEAGFDKRVDPEVIRRLQQEAEKLVPRLAAARMLEAWAGLRPSTPDNLPILSATGLPGYFVATGHFRGGILLAPITAQIMSRMARGLSPEFNLSSFSLARFQN